MCEDSFASFTGGNYKLKADGVYALNVTLLVARLDELFCTDFIE